MSKIIMLTSGKGGTGKSTVATYIATEYALKSKKTLLIELDTGLRSIDIISGVSEKTVYDLGDVLDGNCELAKGIIISPYSKYLHILTAPYQKRTIDFFKLKKIIDNVYSIYDYIILDTAAGLDDAFNVASKVSHTAVIVTTADTISIRDARLVSQNLSDKNIKDVKLIINKFSKENFIYSGFEDIDQIIDYTSAQLVGIVPISNKIAINSIQGEYYDDKLLEKQIFNAISRRLDGETIKTIIK